METLRQMDMADLEHRIILRYVSNKEELVAKGIIRVIHDEIEILDVPKWNAWWESTGVAK